MAQVKPGGVVHIPIAGTRVNLAAPRTPAHSVLICALPSNTGKIYIGDITVVGSTLTGIIGILTAPSSSIPTFSAGVEFAPDALDCHQFYLDADVNGEGVYWSYIEA